MKRIAALARRLPLRLQPVNHGSLRVWLGGEDVTQKIRTEEVSEAAALISQHPEVRAAMVQLQRALANRQGVPRYDSGRHPERSRGGGVVVEGRDTGSVVFPQATYKFFLDADSEIRARRRQRELQKRYGVRVSLPQVRDQLEFRDSLDRHRRVGPLVKPKGAVAVDTSHRSALEVVRIMLHQIDRARTSKRVPT